MGNRVGYGSETGLPSAGNMPAGVAPVAFPVSSRDRAALERRGVLAHFGRGAILMHQGEDADRMMVIRTGHVKVTSAVASGYETVLALRGPGDLVGEMALLDGGRRSATVTAMEAVAATVVGAEAFQTFLRDHPDAAAATLLGTLVNRLRDADRSRSDFGAYPASVRLARHLVDLAERHGVVAPDGEVIIRLALTQQDLAGAIGASRETVAKDLGVLRGRGRIAYARNLITIIDIAAVRDLAFGDDPRLGM